MTLARDLRRRKAREKLGRFTAEGVRTVEELVRSPLAVVGALVAPQLADAPRGAALVAELRSRGVDITEVSAAEFASAAETDSPQGVLAVAEVPSIGMDTLRLDERARVVVLDAVQDPGNVGTILRTSAALGASAVLALPGTVDLWNAKVVRSGMGAQFRMPALPCDWEALDRFCGAHQLAVWGADAGGSPLDSLRAPDRLALVMGNEGAGLSAEGRTRCDAVVALPISSTVESLNVAVATGIFLYQLRT